CTFLTAVGTGLTMVADHASKKRLDSERRRGVRDMVTGWKPRFEDAIDFNVESGDKQTIITFRNRVLETVYHTVKDIGGLEPLACLYKQVKAEPTDPTQRRISAAPQEGIIYAAHPPRSARLRPPNRTLQQHDPTSHGMFACFNKMVAPSEPDRKEFEPA